MAIEIEITSGEKEEKEKEYGPYDKWEIEGAVRTLMEADEIKADKEKMKYVAMCMKDKADKMTNTIKSFDDLRKIANKKAMEE